MTTSIFLGSEISQPNIKNAKFHILPVPFEASVSYGGGTHLGPQSIIEASNQLEDWDGISQPHLAGIYTHPTIDCEQNIADIQNAIYQKTKSILNLGGIPVMLGGEHSVTFFAAKAVYEHYQASETIGIVQFDAHADLREHYHDDPWSHACVMKRLADLKLPIMQLGVRAFSREEQVIRQNNQAQIHYLDAVDLCKNPPCHHFNLPENFPKKVYVTIDIDGLDAAIMPATGTPVPGGLGYWQLLDLFASILPGREVVGFDLVEFSPIPNFYCYDYMAAEILHRAMGLIQRHQFPDHQHY